MDDDYEWGPAFRMPIEHGKVAEFWAALGDEYSPIAPATFLMTQRFWSPPFDWASFGIDLDPRRILHGEQEFSYPTGPVRVGQVLVVRHRIAEDYRKTGSRGGELRFVVRETEFRDEQTGAVACVSRSTTIETSATLGSAR